MKEQRTKSISGEYYLADELKKLIFQIGKTYNPKLILDVDFRLENPFEASTGKKFDLITSTVPLFGQRVIQNGRRYRIEELLVSDSLNYLSEQGVLIALLPITFLTAPLYKDTRLEVLSNYALEMIVEIPAGNIAGTMIQACFVVIRKGIPNETVYLAEYDNNTSQIIGNFKAGTGDFQIPMQKIKDRWDRHFHNPKYDVIDDYLSEKNAKKLEEISSIIRGHQPGRENLKDKGDFAVLSPRHFRDSKIEIDHRTKYVKKDKSQRFENAVLREGDILISLMGNPVLYTYKKDDPTAIANPNIAIIRSRENKYIQTYLESSTGLKLFTNQANRKSSGGVFQHLSINSLRNIKIPILPLEDLNSVSDSAIEEASKNELLELKEKLVLYKELYEQEKKKRKLQNKNNEELMRFLEERFDSVDTALQSVSLKIDQIIKMIEYTFEEIQSIKKSARNEEEKLIRIYSKLTQISDKLSEENKTLKEYAEIVEHWLENWDILDISSQKFLSSAEFLFDQLYKLSDTDYSPFIIQYSRGLENELLKKLFEAYHADINARKPKLNEFVAKDLDNNKTASFAKFITAKNPIFTLGQMAWVMNLIKKNGNTLKHSDLLQDFREFALEYFDEKIIKKEYLGTIKDITDNFRNKAAHPNILGMDIAKDFQDLLRKTLNEFLRNYSPK